MGPHIEGQCGRDLAVLQSHRSLDGKKKQREIINIASDVLESPDARFFLPYALRQVGGVYHDSIPGGSPGPVRINVNSIGPGYTVTEATLGQEGHDDIFTGVVSAQFIKRKTNAW